MYTQFVLHPSCYGSWLPCYVVRAYNRSVVIRSVEIEDAYEQLQKALFDHYVEGARIPHIRASDISRDQCCITVYGNRAYRGLVKDIDSYGYLDVLLVDTDFCIYCSIDSIYRIEPYWSLMPILNMRCNLQDLQNVDTEDIASIIEAACGTSLVLGFVAPLPPLDPLDSSSALQTQPMGPPVIRLYDKRHRDIADMIIAHADQRVAAQSEADQRST